jgi:hypothetical protein
MHVGSGRSPRAAGEGIRGFPLVNYLPVAPVYEPEGQLVNHVALVQLDGVDTEPMNTCNALTAPSEGVRRKHANGVALRRAMACTSSLRMRTIPASRS